MNDFSSIHIFDFGKVQVIGELSGSLNADQIASLPNFIEHIKSKSPNSAPIDDYGVIRIINGDSIKYLVKNVNFVFKSKRNFSFLIDEVDLEIYSAFIEEIKTLLA